MKSLLTIYVCFLTSVLSTLVRQNQSGIAEVETYIKSKLNTLNERWRLHYHVMGPVGWINDPNGFSFYRGEYHLFYQFYPYDSKWGPMHWGHVSSTDLVYWKQLPTALVPEKEQCFSGSAIEDGNNMTIIYTGHIVAENSTSVSESQYLAHSTDGVTFTKYTGNPVIAASPNGSPDFRDPKIWKHEDYWYVVLGSKTDDFRGRILLYRSLDLLNWNFLSVLAESNDPKVYMYECPDFFELDGKFVLLYSPQGMEAEGDRYKNVYQTGYKIGSFNYTTFQFTPEIEFQEIDYGHDFYAAQTMENGGKRYLVSWFNMWEVPHPEAVDGWAGAMTIVRELSISNNRINMKPVTEIIKLRDVVIANGTFAQNKEITFGKTAEIIIQADLSKDVEIQLGGTNGSANAWIRWSADSKAVTVDRGNETDNRRVGWNPGVSKSIRIFLDASSLELFCGEGEVVFSSRIYPIGGWKVTNLSPQNLTVEAYSLKKSFPTNSASGYLATSITLAFMCNIIAMYLFNK